MESEVSEEVPQEKSKKVDENGVPIRKANPIFDENGVALKKKDGTLTHTLSSPPSSTDTQSASNFDPNSQQEPDTRHNQQQEADLNASFQATRNKPQTPIIARLSKPVEKNSWNNIGDFSFKTVQAGLEKDLGGAMKFIGDNFAFSDKNPLSRAGENLRQAGEHDEQGAQLHSLPNTTMGNVASSTIGFAPDILELALTPELDVAKVGKLGEVLTKYGGKYAPKVANMAVGKFPIQQAAKGFTGAYADAKAQGLDDNSALAQALKTGAADYGKGVLFEGAGKAAEKATDFGKKLLEDNGLMAGNKLVAGAEKKLLHSTAQATAFSAVPFITNAVQGKPTSLDEIKNNAIFGGVLGLVHGGEARPDEPTPADGAAKEVLDRSPIVDLNNFMSADMSAIKDIHEAKETPHDLQIKSAIHAEDAFKSDDHAEKQQQIVQSSINGKASSVKAFTQSILKDKDAVISAVNDLPLSDETKNDVIAKINQVHKELDPIEQKKTAFGNQIKDIDEQIQSVSERSDDPIKQAENEVKLESLTKQREETVNSLKDVIIKQNEQIKPNTEIPDEQPADEAVGVPKVADQNDETTKNSPIKSTENEQSTKKHEEASANEEKSSKGSQSGKESIENGEKDDVGKSGEAKAEPKNLKKLPLAEHAELSGLLKEHGVTIKDLQDEQQERNQSGDNIPKVDTNEKGVQQPEDDGTRNDGENREGEEPKSGKGTFKKPEKEVEKTILTQRAYKGEVSDGVKKYLEDKGLTRATYKQEERSKQATEFIDKFGDDAAFRAVESGDIDGGLAASTLAQLQIRNSTSVEDLPEDSDERDELAKKHADLIALMEKKGYFSGEFIGQLAHEYQNKDLNFASIKRQIEKITGKKITKEQETKIKEVTEENERLKKDLQDSEARLIEETDKAFKAGQEDVKNETKTDKAKRIANKLRAAKIHRPGIFSSATPASVAWDGAVEVVAKSIEAGGKLADAIDEGLEHIRNTDWYKGLSATKQSQSEKEFKRFNHENVSSTELTDLQARFVDKIDNKFTAAEARDLWGYMKETYLNSGMSFKDAMSKTATDLGLSWRQVSEAITTPKTKRASDEMWKRQSNLLRNRASVKTWIDQHEASAPVRLLKKISGAFRGIAVFAHGHIFVGTHAGMTLFNPSTWNKTIPAFLRGFKLAYGKTADYERSMEELKNSPNYLIAQRAGLKNDPERINTEEFQKSQQYLGKLGKVGERGFNTIKVLRQALFDSEFNKRSRAEQDDPEVTKEIAKLMNLATGATNLNLPSWVNEATFAGGMEAARWGKLTRNPAKATMTAINALFSPEKATVADRVFAKVWAKRVGEQLATYIVARTVNAAINNALYPTNKEKIFDPFNLDWWKFKFGSRAIDPTSGMRSAAGFIYTIGKVMFENQKELHGDKRDKLLGKEVEGYSRGKLAPLYSTLTDFYANRDFKGNVMPKFPIKALNRYENPGNGKHVLSWTEYGSSKLPLPMAEAFGIFYQSSLDSGVPKTKLDAAVKGIIGGAISGTTGFRVSENKGKMKKAN